MGARERTTMTSGHTPAGPPPPPPPPGETIRRPGETGATANKNERDLAIVKLADSFGELAREAAEALRTERETVRIQKFRVRRWLETIAVALNAHLEEKRTTFDEVVNGNDTYKVDRWWWEMYESIFYELNEEIDPPVTLPRPVAEYKRKEEEQKRLEMMRGGDYVKRDDVITSLDELIDEGVITRETAGAIKNDLGLSGVNIDG